MANEKIAPLEYESLWNDAYVMADTLRRIEAACREKAACSEDPSEIDEICRILFSCTVPYRDEYLGAKDRKFACEKAKRTLERYGKEVEGYGKQAKR